MATQASLFDNIVSDFEQVDPSQEKLASRAALRLVQRGYTVSSITPHEPAARRFNWGKASDAMEVVSIWDIAFYSQSRNGRVLFQGRMTVRQTVRTYFSRDPADVLPDVPAYATEFMPDSRETAEHLKLSDGRSGSGKVARAQSDVIESEKPVKQKAATKRGRGRDWSAAKAFYDSQGG